MKREIINLPNAKIKHSLEHYKKTGEISESLIDADDVFLHKNVYKGNGVNMSLINKIESELKQIRSKNNKAQIKEFEQELINLRTQFKTRQDKFIISALSHKYRPGINPVRVLYFSLQESLFKYENKSDLDRWIINMFKDQIWCNEVINCLQEDCANIVAFQKKYAIKEYKSISDQLLMLNNIRTDFSHYICVFSLMSDWDGDH